MFATLHNITMTHSYTFFSCFFRFISYAINFAFAMSASY
jgi:hypothetical protein